MALSSLQPLSRLAIQEKHFALELSSYQDHLKMDMDLLTFNTTTSSYPQTVAILSTHLPSIFLANCYNDAQLPFSDEVKNTEVAHLFEHIFLAYLHALKISQDRGYFILKGVTTWKENLKGNYNIEVNVGKGDHDLVLIALKQSIDLLNKIILSPTIAKQIAN